MENLRYGSFVRHPLYHINPIAIVFNVYEFVWELIHSIATSHAAAVFICVALNEYVDIDTFPGTHRVLSVEFWVLTSWKL